MAPQNGLASVAEFARLLERERCRAERTGGRFCVVEYSFTSAASFDALSAVLRARLRMYDEIGWLPRGRLGVILPGATAQNAWTVAEDVCAMLPPSCPSPHVEVYAFPTTPAERITRDSAESNSPTTLSNRDEEFVHADDLDPAGETAPSKSPSKSTAKSAANRSPQNLQPARAIDVLFIRPLPRWKRAIDVAAAGTGLLVAAPLIAGIAAAVKLTSRGPIFFRQSRSGLGGQPFGMIKFRSMTVDAEARQAALRAHSEQDGPAFKLTNDPRVTRLGKLLRTTSLDELPQLWNVLVGDMSLVGPRPLPCHETAACDPWQMRRLEATPGLTCTWQVAGRSRVTFAEWMRMDVRYIRTRSLRQDLKLLLKTIPAVLLRRGAV